MILKELLGLPPACLTNEFHHHSLLFATLIAIAVLVDEGVYFKR